MMLKQRLVRGEPIQLGDREIVPEARWTWVMTRRATFGRQHQSARGWMAVHVQPTAVIEHNPTHTRRIPIHNRTHQLLWGFIAGALALPFLMELAVRLARPKCE